MQHRKTPVLFQTLVLMLYLSLPFLSLFGNGLGAGTNAMGETDGNHAKPVTERFSLGQGVFYGASAVFLLVLTAQGKTDGTPAAPKRACSARYVTALLAVAAAAIVALLLNGAFWEFVSNLASGHGAGVATNTGTTVASGSRSPGVAGAGAELAAELPARLVEMVSGNYSAGAGAIRFILNMLVYALYEESLYRVFAPATLAAVLETVPLKTPAYARAGMRACAPVPLSSLVFALSHWPGGVFAVLNAFSASFVLFACLSVSGSVAATVLAHAAYNILVYFCF